MAFNVGTQKSLHRRRSARRIFFDIVVVNVVVIEMRVELPDGMSRRGLVHLDVERDYRERVPGLPAPRVALVVISRDLGEREHVRGVPKGLRPGIVAVALLRRLL